MRKWGDLSLADWLRATLTLRDGGVHDEEMQLAGRRGVERCAQCGRTLLLGETAVRLRVGDQPAVLCSLCAAEARTRRFERAA